MKELTQEEMLEVNEGCIGCHGEGTGNSRDPFRDRDRNRPESDRERYERDRERRERNR